MKAYNPKEEKKRQAQMGKIIKIWQKRFVKEKKDKDTSIEILEEVINLEPVVKTAIEPVLNERGGLNKEVADYVRKQANSLKQQVPVKMRGCGGCGKCGKCVKYYGKRELLTAKGTFFLELMDTNPDYVSRADLEIQLAIWKKYNQLK